MPTRQLTEEGRQKLRRVMKRAASGRRIAVAHHFEPL